MPVVIAWIARMLLTVVGPMALSALVSLGIGFAASKVASGLIDYSGIANKWAAAGDLRAWVGALRIDTSVTVILSAWAGRKIVDAARVHLAQIPSKSSST